MKLDITASIVLYRNNPAWVKAAVASFLNTTLAIKLYLIDNSPSDDLKEISDDPRVEYIFNSKNIGFGRGHNLALEKCIDHSRYHLILNPDVYFNGSTLSSIFAYMQANREIGLLCPLVLYPDSTVQHSGKLLPAPVDLLARRFLKRMKYFKKKNEVYELIDSGYNCILNAPNQLGCFMFLRTETLGRTGLFDENIFMYLEDIDLTRRFHRISKTVFYPGAKVFHHYEKGSQKNLRLFLYHVRSAIYYFNKWGWLNDPERDIFNARVLKEVDISNQDKRVFENEVNLS